MYPILFEWNGFIIPAWHFFYMLAAIAGLFFLFHINLKWNIELNPKHLSGLYACSYIGGYFGARALSIYIDEWNKVIDYSDIFWLLFSFGPMTFYGGMFGASAGAILFANIKGIHKLKILDLGIPCGLLGLCIGRIGCFLNGDDYGIAISEMMTGQTPWWAVTFSNHYDKIPRVPIQIIESSLVFILVISTYVLKNRFANKFSSGLCGYILIISYALIRFLLEYFRGDLRGWVIEGHLSSSQFISLAIVTTLGPIFIFFKRKRKNYRSQMPGSSQP
ncbi:MAG: prolipoprotein diacylglyceryl transferase [Oligoflexales bacterium]